MMKSVRWVRSVRSWAGLTPLLCLCLLTGCVHPEDSGVQVIVGAKLEPGNGGAPLDYSVVVVADGKFRAVGPQSSTPVPIGAKITSGRGMTIEPIPGGEPIAAGRPANLILKGDHERMMRGGVWIDSQQ